ncbi:MAG: helix-turn-helix domain-containing protein [Bacteroidota bacterium]
MSSIGQDLSRIRHYQKLTLQDLHKRTRISLDILEKLEAGLLFEEPVENEVYVRSYIRTYARALGIPEDLVTTALDEQKKGAYDGSLLEPWPDIIEKTTAREIPSGEESDPSSSDKRAGEDGPEGRPTEEDSGRAPDRKTDTPKEKAGGPDRKTGEPKEKTDTSDTQPDAPDAGAETPDTEQKKSTGDSPADTEKRPEGGPGTQPKKGVPGAKKAAVETPVAAPREKKSTDQIDWAAMGKRFSAPSKRSSGWILGFGLVLLFVAAVLWIAFRTDLLTDLFDNGEPAQEMVTEPQETESPAEQNSDLSLDLGSGVDENPDPASTNENESTPTQLDSTLFVTIYGAHGALDPVRVWSDLKPRFDPYWIEQGEAMQFEFRDTLRIRSQYEESLLFLNGHRIDDPREQYYNSAEQSIELTRGLFTPESEWANPRELELPDSVAVPDTIHMRPIFN